MIRNPEFPYLPKDFIQTVEGLIFAVVSYVPEAGKVGCFLRYVPDGDSWRKIGTEQANQLLEAYHPQYLYYSETVAAHFHAVAVENIVVHYQPEQRLQELLTQPPTDEIEEKLHRLIPILVQYKVDRLFLGLTGSMLIGQQKENSDIDLVLYGRTAFHQARQAIKQAIADKVLNQLDEALMEDHFQRRSAVLNFKEFSWHEFRKYNKATIDGTKFDIGMVLLTNEQAIDSGRYTKQGTRIFKTRVVNARYGFDMPARFIVDDVKTPEILSFTHTYVGQAVAGEIIEVSGAVECDEQGRCRLIVGSSREAIHEYIKVIRE